MLLAIGWRHPANGRWPAPASLRNVERTPAGPMEQLDTAAIIFLVTLATTTLDKILDRFYPDSKVRGLIDLVLHVLSSAGKLPGGR